jgi:very-long-chain enoyl-CoA reductase
VRLHFQTSDHDINLSSTIRNLIILHFIKRFYESVFVHTFSRPTVPLAYIFRK